MRIPVDSADAQELREIESEQLALEQRHHGLCRDGILGEDAAGHQVPCPRCKPHLYAGACPTCSRSQAGCAGQQIRTAAPCCDRCAHAPVPQLEQMLGVVVDTQARAARAARRTDRALTADDVLPVTVPGDFQRSRPDRILLVEDPELGLIRVRWDLGNAHGRIWRCSECGHQTRATCAHTLSAALRLAQDILGLEPWVPAPDRTAHTHNPTKETTSS